MRVTEVALTDLLPDPENARRHTPENIRAIKHALATVGPARSIVVDEDQVVMAGNGVAEAALSAGFTKVLIIEADGETVVAVRKTGLTDEEKQILAIADNRANELSQWDGPTLKQQLEGLDGTKLGFLPDEIARAIRGAVTAPDTFKALPDALETTHTCAHCGYEW